MTFTGAVVRFRYLIFAALAAAAAVPIWRKGQHSLDDLYYFVYGGKALVGTMPGYHDGALHLYAVHPGIQIGPLPLAIFAPISGQSPGVERAVWLVLMFTLALVTVRAVESLAQSPWWRTMLHGVGVMALFAVIALSAHLDDALAVTGIAVAVAGIKAKRPWWIPAVALGLAASCKPWAVIVAPLLLVLPRSDLPKAFGVYLLATFGPWLPFVIADPKTVSALASVRVSVTHDSGLHALGMPYGVLAPAGIHTMMLVLGLLLAALAVSRGKWEAVPFVALACRPLLEPQYNTYYGAALVFAALLWDVLRGHRLPWWAMGAAAVDLGLPYLTPGTPVGVAQVALAVVMIVTVLAKPMRSDALEGGGTYVDARPVHVP